MSKLLKRIIPCLDVDNGRVVKGVNFVNLRDMGDPVELAYQYQQQGADEVVLLDITATSDQRATALQMVRAVAKTLSIPFTLGGGLRSIEDIYAFLDAGADKVALNSAALYHPELVRDAANQFGSQCIVVAIDVNHEPDGQYVVYSHGGRKRTEHEARSWARYMAECGAGEILLTAMHRDGTGIGFDVELTGELGRELPIQVIASGGAKTSEHLAQALTQGADAVLAASMFHTGQYTIDQVKRYLASQNIAVRL